MGLFSRKKKQEIGRAKGTLGSLSSTLPDRYRAAIVLLLWEIAASNNHTTIAEEKMQAAALDYLSIACKQDLNPNGQAVLKTLLDEIEIHEAIQMMGDLNELQKVEVMCWCATMANLDVSSPRSFAMIDEIAKRMGLNLEQFAKQHAEAITSGIKYFTN